MSHRVSLGLALERIVEEVKTQGAVLVRSSEDQMKEDLDRVDNEVEKIEGIMERVDCSLTALARGATLEESEAFKAKEAIKESLMYSQP